MGAHAMHKQHFVRPAFTNRSRRISLVGLVLLALVATLLGALPTSVLPAAEAAVPTAPANAAVISVSVGGDRLADGAVKGLAGVTLALYGPGTANSSNGNTAVQGGAGNR